MTQSSSFSRLARLTYRRRRYVVGLWVGLVLMLSALSATVGGELVNDFSIPGSESEDTTELLDEGGLGSRGGYTGQVVFHAGEGYDGVDDPEVRSAMEAFFSEITTEVAAVSVLSPYSKDAAGQIAPDGQVAIAELQFGDISLDEASELADEVVEVGSNTQLPGDIQVELGGDLFFEQAEPSSEMIGFVAAMVIMLIAFGSVLAMGFPIITALFGIAAGLGLIGLIANGIDIPEFGPQAAMLISIGVGIDYALLIVTRYRDELRAGHQPQEAVMVAMSTAGRAVFFAGATVIVALLGLMVSGVGVFQSLAVATTAGVLLVMLATLTLVPALLGFAGPNIDRLSVHRRKSTQKPVEQTVWYRWSRLVQRRPAPVAAVAMALLLLLAVPVLGMRLGFSDAGNRPDTDTSRQAYDLVSESFGPGYNGPLILAADLPGDAAEDAEVLDRLQIALGDDEGVAQALPPKINDAGDVGFVQVFPTTSPQESETTGTVQRLRDQVLPGVVEGTSSDVLVGGMAAAAIDFADVQASQLPVFIVAVLVVSFILLIAVFRSVVVALKAVIMNLLSIGAAYGAIVAMFQWGWGADLLGLGEPGPIEAWAPMSLFAITFGLSIDYEVFLISRMKEEYDRTGNTTTAVADGLAKTARIITAAAAIMVCVAGGFVLSDERGVQIFGLGLAVAILVDAALVRTLLVPAAMELMGDRNWWMPAWLNRLLPRLDIDGSSDDTAPTPTPEPELVSTRQ